MSHATRFVVGVAAAIWLTWACGSSSTGGDGSGTGASAGDAGEGSGGDSATGATSSTAGKGGNTGTGGATSEGGASQSGGAGNPLGGAGSGDAGTGPFGPDCSAFGATCVQSTECCSGICDPNTNQCARTPTCLEAGKACASQIECCSFQCGADGKCAVDTCVSDTDACQADTECCSGSCVDGACDALNQACKTGGNACQGDQDCCSGQCGENGTCTLGGSYCIQPGDVCARGRDCCTGICDIADGKTLGVCRRQPAGSAFCTGVDGVLCDGCGDCCSRLCAPFGPTGVKICQPANGCHVTGDLCRRNEDCCGGTDDETLPGWGNVICEKEQGAEVGLCRNPSNGASPGGACNPQGNVCHFQNYSCDISSARANCCGGLGAKGGVCELDPLGIPRCNGLGDSCRAAGESCASTADCCDDKPCVPDANGDLHCGTGECQRSGSSCTVNADCCPGAICLVAPGSIVGTCGGDTGDPGSGGAGNGDAGAPSTAGSGGSGTGGTGNTSCSEYGQLCDGAGDCCNAVPCTNGICRYPAG